jgi:DNA-binding response OmpR family regulator
VSRARERPLVVVADDEEDILTLLGVVLRSAGCDVLPAGDGEEALRLAEEHRPDLVVLDVAMPRVDGREATAAIRASEALAGVPVLLISASTSDADRDLALSSGADAFVSKPFSPAALTARVRALLEP